MKQEINEAVRRQVRDYFRQSQILFFVFLIGLVMFMATAYIVIMYQQALNPEYAIFLLVMAPLSGIALVVISYRLFMGRIKNAQEQEGLYEKMEGYRGAMVLRYILLDGAAFVQIITFIMTGNKLYLLLCLVIVTLFFMNRPGLERFISDMELNDVESQVMRDHYHAK